MPQLDLDNYHRPDAEALLATARERLRVGSVTRRAALVQGTGAVAFLAAAVLLATLARWQHPLSALRLVLVLVAWVLVERVSFPVAGGWTRATMLAFVPALFLLPAPVVPLVAAAAVVLRSIPDVVGGRLRFRSVFGLLGDAWFSVGPALVITLAGAQQFNWAHWPIYAAAFGAQVLFDMAWTLSMSSAEGNRAAVVLPLLSWVYVVDGSLLALGIAIAAVSVVRPGLVLLAVPPIAMLWLFSRERRQRIDEELALSSAYRGTALLLGDIVETDDHYTGLHSRDVVDLAVAVAREMRLSRAQQRDVEFAALLHDVGKIRVPKEVINKPGPLELDEWEMVRRHTIDGEQMLKLVGGTLASVGRIVRSSHERYDGRGYPDGLAAAEIPIEARIVCACDAYAAMTTDRPYRAAMAPGDALAELRRCAATQFDPNVVVAIEQLLDPGGRSWLDLLAATKPSDRSSASPPPSGSAAQAHERPPRPVGKGWTPRHKLPGPADYLPPDPQPSSMDPAPTRSGSLVSS